jgi:hypothetical protein
MQGQDITALFLAKNVCLGVENDERCVPTMGVGFVHLR